MLDPDHGYLQGTRSFDRTCHVLDDSWSVPGIAHHSDLRVDDQQNRPVALTYCCHSGCLRTNNERAVIVEPGIADAAQMCRSGMTDAPICSYSGGLAPGRSPDR